MILALNISFALASITNLLTQVSNFQGVLPEDLGDMKIWTYKSIDVKPTKQLVIWFFDYPKKNLENQGYFLKLQRLIGSRHGL
jgi:hypothetical protein